VSAPVSGRPIRLGILSAAHHHADGYLEISGRLPEVELVGLWDEDGARGAAAAAAHRTQAFETEADLLDAGLDGVIVCSVTRDHRRLVELAAAASVHVLCEKPLATRIEDAQAIVAACAAADVRLMTAFPMRFSPVLRELHASVRSGAIGTLVSLEGVNTGEMPDVHRAWFVDPVLAGGGALMDHVVHLADLYRWILGGEVHEVYAVSNRILQDGYAGVETGGLVSLRFGDGVIATIDCSWSKPRSYPTWGGLALEVVGTDGVVTTDAYRQHLVVHGRPEDGTSWPFWGSDPNVGMLAEFVAAIRDGRQPAIDGIDGLRALEVVEAAYRSVASGAPVQIR
jgi:predicted dehydrogenase